MEKVPYAVVGEDGAGKKRVLPAMVRKARKAGGRRFAARQFCQVKGVYNWKKASNDVMLVHVSIGAVRGRGRRRAVAGQIFGTRAVRAAYIVGTIVGAGEARVGIR